MKECCYKFTLSLSLCLSHANVHIQLHLHTSPLQIDWNSHVRQFYRLCMCRAVHHIHTQNMHETSNTNFSMCSIRFRTQWNMIRFLRFAFVVVVATLVSTISSAIATDPTDVFPSLAAFIVDSAFISNMSSRRLLFDCFSISEEPKSIIVESHCKKLCKSKFIIFIWAIITFCDHIALASTHM